MKIIESNAGPLTNFEVLKFLESKGASNDPTRVLADVTQSEFKVYDYLVETAALSQTEEKISEFFEKCKKYDLAKAELLNIVNVRPSSVVEIYSMIEQCDARLGDDVEELVETVTQVLVPPPVGPTSDDVEANGKKPMETS